jgi:hypothetical protein
MTTMRADVDATLRALPQARALRKVAVRESEQLAVTVDRIACSPFAPSLRVVLLLEVAYRALLAAASVMVTARVPATAIRAVSPRPVVASRLLVLAHAWRDRCSGCGKRFGRAGHVHCCAPGKCAPITGWEPRITPGLDGTGEWDG